MNPLDEQTIQCPYCGEMNSILLDCSVAEQDYIEDCQVCCRPMELQVSLLAGDEPQVRVMRDDE